jgi:UDP-N-acetyl-D-mannosaminuronic acid dehydrogenase
VVGKIVERLADLESPVVACLGLAYKPDVDDLRESPAVEIVEELASRGLADILAVEPFVESLPPSLAGRGVKHVALEQALERANLVVLLVDHAPFRAVDRKLIEGKAVIDTRGVW